MNAPDLPRSLDDLTPGWLTAALREKGVLKRARVVATDSEVLGEGVGFMGGLARLRLRLDVPEPTAPTSLVAKLPTPRAEAREAGELLGLYEREVRFYSELAASVPLRTPRCYFAAMDPNPGARWEEPGLRFLERTPAWTLPLLMWLGSFAARHSQRRYVLLLEDMEPARTGDQVVGCTAGEAEGPLRELARLHAAFWEQPRPWPHPWVRRLDTVARLLHVSFRQAQRRLKKNGHPQITPRLGALGEWLTRHGVHLAHSLAGPPATLLHADYRLDNLMLLDRGPETEQVVLDWQIPALGLGVYDVAYFLVGNLRQEVPDSDEEALVRVWHDELLALGVEGYGLDTCLADYRRARLFMLYRVVPGLEAVDLVHHERGRELLRVWLERLDARLAGVRPDELMRWLPSPRG